MPTYEYRCENDHHFEEFQSMVAPPIETCPVCGGKAERLISGGSGLIFKGSGFYITDYARGSSQATASEAKSSSTSASGPKSDASSAADSGSKKE